MKRVLTIGHNYFPELIGIGKYTTEFCNYLVSNGNCKVDVITGNPYYPKWKVFEGYKNKWFTKEHISGVRVYRAPLYIPSKPTGFKRLLQDSLFLASVFFIVTWMLLRRKKKYDYIFIAVPSFMLGLAGLYYRFFYPKTTVLYHIQDLQIDAAENLGMIQNKTLIKALYNIERYVLNRVNYVSTISEGMRAKILYKSVSDNNCIIFPNWVNNKHIFPIYPEPVFSKEELHNKKIIFYSGAIGEKQGLEMIIEAAAYFSANPDFVFIISGEGPYKQKLIEKCRQEEINNIKFSNLLPTQEFNELLNASYLSLIIQKESGSDLFLPSKLTNILATGRCVIVTALENTSLYKIITEHNCGYLIPPSDTQALCNAIEELDRDAEKRKMYSGNALNYALNLHEDKVIGNYIQEVGILEPDNSLQLAS